ncbi:hypothetical protein [Bailinhaonella thermotolerans]|uniref:Uncharacterized protein n=1 Tax=Bailinhaonella thermotolerans TaxID=1070861 RepID=A0A3A4A119_9ACTN|nr:hypothetical protein [Bailinhaonella thermotolerans]RJL19977.1 hypothetical protein D5H75_40015 [Bailinhaonella thermotolerans]
MTPSETLNDQASEDLVAEVRALVRDGLPVRRAGARLQALPGVRTRATDPSDRASLCGALESMLREELDRLDKAEWAQAARLLFGADASTALALLTSRRTAAAAAAGYEVHHFRKRIEPKICELVALQLRRASDAVAAAPAAPTLHPSRGPLVLPADVFAWEAAEHQHSVASLWGAAYLLRAELVTVARLLSMGAGEQQIALAADRALWRHAQVLAATAAYRAAYGAALLHTAADVTPEQIGASAGWTPTLTPTQDLLLAALGDPEQGFAAFTAALAQASGGAGLAATWRRALTGRTGSDQKEPT